MGHETSGGANSFVLDASGRPGVPEDPSGQSLRDEGFVGVHRNVGSRAVPELTGPKWIKAGPEAAEGVPRVVVPTNTR